MPGDIEMEFSLLLIAGKMLSIEFELEIDGEAKNRFGSIPGSGDLYLSSVWTCWFWPTSNLASYLTI